MAQRSQGARRKKKQQPEIKKGSSLPAWGWGWVSTHSARGWVPTNFIGDRVPKPMRLEHGLSEMAMSSSFPFGIFIAEMCCTLSKILFASVIRGIHAQRERGVG